jgi:hypothetical protein
MMSSSMGWCALRVIRNAKLEEFDMTTKAEMSELISEALYETYVDSGEVELIDEISTFDEVGMLSNNTGLVIATEDGSEFQVTIVQSK